MTDVTTETISYGGAAKLPGFLAVPEGKGPFPALVVIHEWWGLNDQIKAAGVEFARAGYVALAVDLYRGSVTSSVPEAQKLMMSLDRGRAVSDLEEAFRFLSSRPYVRAAKIGSVGWCMGGGFSLQLALAEPRLAASVVYYGHLETNPTALKKINAPVIGFFGQDDASLPVSEVRSFESAMKEAGRLVSVHIYAGAGHAFANPTRTDAYRPEATKDAWERMMTFLAAAL